MAENYSKATEKQVLKSCWNFNIYSNLTEPETEQRITKTS